MAMNYKILENGYGYSVLETATEHIIYTFDNRSDAKKMMKHLNLGGGFDGFTPNFFLKNVANLSQNTK